MEQVKIIFYDYSGKELENEINKFLLSGKVYKCLSISLSKNYACILYEPNLKHLDKIDNNHTCKLCGQKEERIKNKKGDYIYKCLSCNPDN